jgi:hypothetical protein
MLTLKTALDYNVLLSCFYLFIQLAELVNDPRKISFVESRKSKLTRKRISSHVISHHLSNFSILMTSLAGIDLKKLCA